MKITVIGSNGQLGWELVQRGRRKGLDILGVDTPDIDITVPASIEAFLPATIDCVINAAAYTNVDKAETEPDAAFAVNRDGPGHLARHCRTSGLPLIHISTDYVFDGTGSEAYSEDDPVSPMGVYAESKAAGEEEVRELLPTHIIIRTAWLYGVHGRNFVKTILTLGRDRPVVRVVDDQRGCPTYAAELADAILTVAARITQKIAAPWGTYHYCGGGTTSWHGFAAAIYELAGRYEKLAVQDLVPIKTAEYPVPAARPANSVLDCRKIEKNFGIAPRPWKESLERMINDLYTGVKDD